MSSGSDSDSDVDVEGASVDDVVGVAGVVLEPLVLEPVVELVRLD